MSEPEDLVSPLDDLSLRLRKEIVWLERRAQRIESRQERVEARLRRLDSAVTAARKTLSHLEAAQRHIHDTVHR
jgi:hypothetical protein